MNTVPVLPLSAAPMGRKLEITGSSVLSIFVQAMLQQTQQFKVTPLNRSGVYWLEYQSSFNGVDAALVEVYKDSVRVLIEC